MSTDNKNTETEQFTIPSVSASLYVVITPNVYETNGYIINEGELKEWKKDGSLEKGGRLFKVVEEINL